MVITIIIEVGLLLLMKLYTKSNLKITLKVNITTQLLLNITLFLSNYKSRGIVVLFTLFLGEIIILLVEMIAYLILFREKNKGIIILYTIIANVIIFLAGLIFFNSLQ